MPQMTFPPAGAFGVVFWPDCVGELVCALAPPSRLK